MLIPSYVLLAFLIAEALDWIQERGRAANVVAWLATLALLFSFGRSQQVDKNIILRRQSKPPVVVKAASIGNILREAFAERNPFVAVDAAGAIPFYSGLRSLDGQRDVVDRQVQLDHAVLIPSTPRRPTSAASLPGLNLQPA